MSSVYDEPPPKRRTKGKRASKSAKDSEEVRDSLMLLIIVTHVQHGRRASREASRVHREEGQGDEGEEGSKRRCTSRGSVWRRRQLSPEEARVADLKRIVVACGVRKQWCVPALTYVGN